MSFVHVIKLTAGKVTSRHLRYKHSCFKTKNRKITTDRDFYSKKKSNAEISQVKLTAKKRGLIKWETFQKAAARVTSKLKEMSEE